MAYGCTASLDHAVAKLETASKRMGDMNDHDRMVGYTTEERRLLFELASAIAYVSDAVRYLRDGVP